MQSNKPKAIIYEEQTFNVGKDTFIESTAENDYAVIFEGYCRTGFPQTNNPWVKQKERKLTDASLNELFKPDIVKRRHQ